VAGSTTDGNGIPVKLVKLFSGKAAAFSKAAMAMAHLLSPLLGGGRAADDKNRSANEDDIPVEYDTRGSNPALTVPLTSSPIKVEAAKEHYSQPRLHKTAFATHGELHSLNKKLNWRQALFENGPGYYYAKCPQAPHVAEKVDYIDVAFMLPSEYVTHSDFFEDYASKGKVALPIIKSQLFKFLSDKIDHTRKDYHVMPKHIQVLDVYSTLPVSFDLTLKSRVTSTSWQSWSQPRGVGNVNSENSRGNKFINLVIPPEFKGELPEARRTIFVADERHNEPNFLEYINLDFDVLLKQLATLKTSYNGMQVYKIVTPVAEETNFSLVFWFVLNEWPYIKSRTNAAGWGGGEYQLNHFVTDNQSSYIFISTKILNELINERMKAHAHGEHLMNLTDVVVELTPLLGDKGWKDYEAIVKKRRKDLVDSDDRVYAKFLAIIRIAFERYAGAVPEADAAPVAGISRMGLKNDDSGANQIWG
jgi:hypothetical protein